MRSPSGPSNNGWVGYRKSISMDYAGRIDVLAHDAAAVRLNLSGLLTDKHV